MEQHRGAIGAGILAAIMSFAVLMIFVGAVQGPEPREKKVTICHKPGTPAQKTMKVPEPAVKGHLGHGDHLGECAPLPDPTAKPIESTRVLPTSVPPATATRVMPTKVPTKPPPPATATNTPAANPTDKPVERPTEEPTIKPGEISTAIPVALQTVAPIFVPTSDAVCAQTVVECQFCCPGEEAKAYAEADEAYARADIWQEIARAMRENIFWDILYKFAER